MKNKVLKIIFVPLYFLLILGFGNEGTQLFRWLHGENYVLGAVLFSYAFCFLFGCIVWSPSLLSNLGNKGSWKFKCSKKGKMLLTLSCILIILSSILLVTPFESHLLILCASLFVFLSGVLVIRSLQRSL
ncbi:hypothetical protein [Brevibacillus laterosporus]|uniref:hypothetical protein n=1 Tax=Brevibacillus laterosporus TaxID=1465 RepID=UPI000839CCF2|nr:hypothetical protein [Brevibacillus laterosporus]